MSSDELLGAGSLSGIRSWSGQIASAFFRKVTLTSGDKGNLSSKQLSVLSRWISIGKGAMPLILNSVFRISGCGAMVFGKLVGS